MCFALGVEVGRIELPSIVVSAQSVYIALAQIGFVRTNVPLFVMVLVVSGNQSHTIFLAFLHSDRTSENHPWNVSRVLLRSCESRC